MNVSTAEIKSIKALREWLNLNSGSDSQWFACPHPTRGKCLLVSDQPWHDFQWDSYTTERRLMYPIELPDLKNARDWWFDIWEREIATFRYSRASHIVLVAKTGAWDAIPEWYLSRPKSEFVEIPEELLRDILGKRVVSQMVLEHNFCGVSTRTLDYDTAQRFEEQLQ